MNIKISTGKILLDVLLVADAKRGGYTAAVEQFTAGGDTIEEAISNLITVLEVWGETDARV